MEINYYALIHTQVASENQLLCIMWGGVRMNILKKSKNEFLCNCHRNIIMILQ